MSKYDLEQITIIINDIEGYFSDLNEMKVESIDKLENKEKFYAVSMVLLSIINKTINLGDEIVASLNIGMPSKYSDIFYLLRRNSYISESLAEDLFDLVRYRNLLSHEYSNFTKQDVFNILQKIGVVNSFVKTVKELINKV